MINQIKKLAIFLIRKILDEEELDSLIKKLFIIKKRNFLANATREKNTLNFEKKKIRKKAG